MWKLARCSCAGNVCSPIRANAERTNPIFDWRQICRVTWGSGGGFPCIEKHKKAMWLAGVTDLGHHRVLRRSYASCGSSSNPDMADTVHNDSCDGREPWPTRPDEVVKQ